MITIRRLPLAVVVLAAAVCARDVGAAEPSSQDRRDIRRIEAYLNGIRTLSADFIQVAPDGSIDHGRLHLKRPGRLRFEYEPPAPVLVVADGTYVNYFDAELGQLSQIGVYATPLGAILAREVRLGGGIAVTSVERGSAVVSLRIIDAEEPDRGTLTLIFSERPLELRKWEVTDSQGLTTTVALDNLSINPDLDPELFVFRQPGVEEGRGGD